MNGRRAWFFTLFAMQINRENVAGKNRDLFFSRLMHLENYEKKPSNCKSSTKHTRAFPPCLSLFAVNLCNASAISILICCCYCCCVCWFSAFNVQRSFEVCTRFEHFFSTRIFPALDGIVLPMILRLRGGLLQKALVYGSVKCATTKKIPGNEWKAPNNQHLINTTTVIT